MHVFPKDPETRIKWVKFVQKHRADFITPSQHSSICSAHFEESCYIRKAEFYEEAAQNPKAYRVLIRGSVPTKDSEIITQAQERPEVVVGGRERRQVGCFVGLNS